MRKSNLDLILPLHAGKTTTQIHNMFRMDEHAYLGLGNSISYLDIGSIRKKAAVIPRRASQIRIETMILTRMMMKKKIINEEQINKQEKS